MSLLAPTLPVVVGDLPSLTAEGIVVRIAGYSPTLQHFSQEEDLSIYQPLIQFGIRSKHYTEGMLWGTLLRDKFHQYHDDELLAMSQVGVIVTLGRNPSGLHEFQVTFTTHIKE